MTVYLKGTLKPGEVDRRYYMIRVQRKARRVVVSSNTRDKTLALRKDAYSGEHDHPFRSIMITDSNGR